MNKKKNINYPLPLVVVCGQSFFQEPVSGGDVLNFDFLQNVKGFLTYLIINDITLPYAKKKLVKCNFFSIKDFLNLNILIKKYLFFVPFGFLNSAIKITQILFSNFEKPLILYSSGDFICNVLPMVLYKHKFPSSKIIIRIHHINESPLTRKGNSFLASVVSFFFQRLSFYLIKKNADMILLLNSEVKKSLSNIGFLENKMEVIGVGIDFSGIMAPDSNKRNNTIIFFARLSKTKGIFDLSEILRNILKKIPKAKLVLIGAANEDILEVIRAEFIKYNIQKNVEFKGFIHEKKEIYSLMNKSKVFILPSYEEGWGLTVFEAIACGLTPVVYDLPVFREIFGKEIISVSKGDIVVFAEEVIKLLTNETKRKAYNIRLREIIGRYDLDKILDRQIGLIEKVARM